MSLTFSTALLIRRLPKLRNLSLRHFSTEPDTTPPLPQSKEPESLTITQAVDFLLQTPQKEWISSSQLNDLLFSSSPSPRLFLQITRRFPSSSQALAFFDYLRSNSLSRENTQLLSSSFQAILELASREPDAVNKLSELYKTCQEQSVPLSVNAATLLIRYFGRADLVDQSLVVYNELDPSMRNTHIRNVLIEVLLRHGLVDDALKVIDEMLSQDSEFPPNQMTGNIVFYVLKKKNYVGSTVSDEETVQLVKKLAAHDISPNSLWLTQFVTRLCRNRKTNQASEVIHSLMKSGAVVEAPSCNALLSGLGKERAFGGMSELLTEMKENDIDPDCRTYGIIINHLCKSRRVDQAMDVFEEMSAGAMSVEPDVVIYNTLIDGLCKLGRVEEGLSLMERMRSQEGCAPNVVTYNCLIDGFCKSGDIEKGRELFHGMNLEGIKPSVITLNTLVDGMCRHGRIGSAVKFFKDMREKGLKGNTVTYTVLINAFCNVNNIGEAMEWFKETCQSGCSVDAVVYYALISGLCQAGKMNDAISVVEKLKEAGFGLDVVCYNVLIGGFCRTNKLDKAYEMVKDMEEVGVKPDCVTYNTLISFCSKMGNFGAAKRLMKKMKNEGLVPTVVTYGALINAFCLSGNIAEAMKIFKDMSCASKVAPNTIIYNILVDSLCKNNEVDAALSLMDDMKVNGVKPNTNTYNAMFKGLRDKNMLETTFKFMDKMVEDACLPDYITMEILTEWLSGAGKAGKLRKFLQGYEVSNAAE